MKAIALNREDIIPEKTGVNISFNSFQWAETAKDSFSLRAGQNITYSSLKGASALHTHEFTEIIFVLSGKISHFVNSETQELSAGSIVFIRPNDVHSFQQFGKNNCELVNVAFNLKVFRSLSEYLQEDAFLKTFTASVLPPIFQISIKDIDNICLKLLKLNSLQLTDVSRVKVEFRVILAELFVKFFLTERIFLNYNPDIPEWLEMVRSQIRKEENFTKGLKRLHSLAPCSPEHLCKLFRKFFNQTPTELINELRISHAAYLLNNTNEEIFAISVDLGFQSLSRFYFLFRQQYEMPPAKYRKIMRKNSIPI